jgi:hypothetical protein
VVQIRDAIAFADLWLRRRDPTRDVHWDDFAICRRVTGRDTTKTKRRGEYVRPLPDSVGRSRFELCRGPGAREIPAFVELR